MALGFIVGFVTAPDKVVGARIARAVVEQGLAACVNILPHVRSIYSWDGEICDEAEVLLVLKTRSSLFDELRKKVLELHPYEVPEVIAFELAHGEPKYLDWMARVTAGRRGTTPSGRAKRRQGRAEP